MRDRRNLAIALLAAAVAVLGGLLAREWGSREAEPELADPASPDRRPVSAIDVQVDLEGLRQIEILFDRPLGDGKVGEVLGRDPVVIAPRVGGSWSWVAANVLRFDATRRLTPAMRYELTIFPGQLLGGEGADEPGEASALVWTGPRVFEVQTDAFQVERIDVHEEYDPEGEGRIVLRGELRFNYRVEPRELAPRLTLSDPAASEPIAVQLETTYASKTIGWRSDPVEKGAAERELRLTVGADLTSRAGNVPLPADYIRRVRVGSRELLVVRSVAARPELAESSIDITLSSAVDPEVAGSHVSVEPAVAFRLSADRNVLRLRGAFVPGRAYALELGAGLRATDGAALAAPHRQPVRLADLPQSIAFRGEGMFLSAAGDRRIGLDTVNVDRLQLIVERVYRNNVLYLVQQQGHQVFSGRGWGEVSRVLRTFPSDGKMANIQGPQGEANRAQLLEQLKSVEPEGWTNTLDALKKAYTYQGVDTILLFSDGAPTFANSGRFDPNVAEQIYALCREHPDVPINTVGLGNYFDQNLSTFLRTVANISGGTFRGR